jgi:uncharacterized protein (DUF488 family)
MVLCGRLWPGSEDRSGILEWSGIRREIPRRKTGSARDDAAMVLYSIGHSTRNLEELIEVLQSHSIETLADIRAFPTSRRLPHFNRQNLETTLAPAEVRYVWLPGLGGRRKKVRDDSPNIALRSPSFRNYADYMLTDEFNQAITELLKLAGTSRTAYMCAERVYFRCHRMLVSDWLVIHGHEVRHIDGTAPPKPHKLTPEARLVEGQLIYRGDHLL